MKADIFLNIDESFIFYLNMRKLIEFLTLTND
jgi:hypothetical protein